MSKRNWFLAAALIILSALILLGAWLRFGRTQSGPNALLPTATLASTCTDWQAMPVASQQNVSEVLDGIAALSASDIWTVGQGMLIEHWNGANWQLIRAQSAGDGNLSAIAAISARDIWAVGEQNNLPLTLHWDGQFWNAVPLPVQATSGRLSGIAALAHDNVWTVGSTTTGQASHALIEHWNGSSWQEVPGASANSAQQLGGISAVSAQDIWAVGSLTGPVQGTRELMEHWNGTAWQLVANPGQAGTVYHIDSASLNSVTVISTNDVWAAGEWNLSGNGADGSALGLLEHWDGQRWSRAQISGPESRLNFLKAIKAFSADNIWAVGAFTDPNTRLGRAYLQHWDGKQWGMSTWPDRYGQVSGEGSFGLNDVSATPDGRVLAVGSETIYTQNPPIDGAAHNAPQPFVLASCQA